MLQGTIICPFYMKTGTCRFGQICRFDHPPPGEVMAKAVGVQGSSGEENTDEGADEAIAVVAAAAMAAAEQQ